MSSITVLGQRRAVTELDTAVKCVEAKRQELLATTTRLVAVGQDPAQLYALLRITDDYLACLRQSRGILLWELPQQASSRRTPPVETGATGLRPRLVE
jgi:hypothetical protein